MEASTNAGRPTDASKEASSDAEIADDVVPMTSEELTVRAKHLVDAIVADNAELAVDFLLSREAYAATHTGKDLGRQWEAKIKRPFSRAIHRLHRKRRIDHATFGSFQLGSKMTKKPLRHGRKNTSYWHVQRSTLTIQIEGKSLTLRITELAAWKGAWYILRL